MSKEKPLRDEKGRFSKKSEQSQVKKSSKPTKKEYRKVAESMCEKGEVIIRAELIGSLQKERDTYKELAERLGSDYLNKCAEYGKLRRELEAYQNNWPALKKIAKYWKKRALKLDEEKVDVLDAFRDCVGLCGKLLNLLPRWKYRWYKKEIDEQINRITDSLLEAEGLNKE